MKPPTIHPYGRAFDVAWVCWKHVPTLYRDLGFKRCVQIIWWEIKFHLKPEV